MVTWIVAANLFISQSNLPVTNTDRDVIQTAMLSFFKHEDWHSVDWKPRRRVYLRTQLESQMRKDFSIVVEELLAQNLNDETSLAKTDEDRFVVAAKKTNQQQQKILVALQAMVAEPPSFTPPELRPLSSFKWDQRITLTDSSGFYGSRSTESKSRSNKRLEQQSVYAKVSRPVYSPTGSHCLVKLEVPWSMHSSDLWFILKRNSDGWLITTTITKFYG